MEERIEAILKHKLNLDVPSLETDLIVTGILDSVTLVELLLQLEDEFHTRISIEDLQIDTFRSISGISHFLSQHLEQNSGNGAS